MSKPPAERLPAGLAAQVEAATGATLVAVRTRSGGGASREGAELTLRYPDGRELDCYMSHDTQKQGAGTDDGYAREAAALRAFSGPLKDSGVRTAPFVAVIPESRALITSFLPGVFDFNLLTTPQDRSAVAGDYMAQLARLHAIDVARTPVEGMGEVKPPSVTVKETLQWLKDRDTARGSDALTLLTFDWLERNVPPDPPRPSIVHGDAGPANFLYENNKVTAVLDWELVHYGDPMADLAMVCIRNLFQPWIPLPEAFAAYEAAGGAKVDLAKVRFYRNYFQVRFAGPGQQNADPHQPIPVNFAMRAMHTTIHRNVLAESLAEAAGVTLPPATLPECGLGPYWRSFEAAIGDLRQIIGPEMKSQRGIDKSRGLMRMVKWWRDIDRYGAAFDAQETAELSQALGKPFANVFEGRDALCAAIQAHAIDDPTAMRLCHARTVRDRALMADAMGGLANNRFKPLE